MHKYAILINNGHNRVYYDASKKLAISELKLAFARYDKQNNAEIAMDNYGNIPYITFSIETELNEELLKVISGLSFVFALFESRLVEAKEYLLPIEFSSNNYFDSKISSLLKYTGKTNELFTRLLLNIAEFTLDCKGDTVALLDPVAGKGTTLFEGLIKGYDVYGVEINDKATLESFNYIKKFLESEKYKHQIKKEKFSGENKSFKAQRYAIDITCNKNNDKESRKHWEIVESDSKYCDKLFKKQFFDIIVGDLPYGVQHGNVANKQQSSAITRNPKELLHNCLKPWYNSLRTGGVIALAWNRFILPREDFEEEMRKVGFDVCDYGAYMELEHRVDQAIMRDVIVAIKR